MPDASPFTALDAADRAVLTGWLERVGPSGVDAVVDFSPRPWKVDGARAVIGVFVCEEALARWLIAWHAEGWLLIRPADGFVLASPRGLPEILAMIEAGGG